MEDLQLRALCKTRVFEKASDILKGPGSVIPKLVATSSRYGITVVVAPNNKIYSCDISNIHQLGLPVNGQSDISNCSWRVIHYHDSQSEICFLDISADGNTLAITLNTASGPFVHLFDVRCFHPGANKQPFPVASIRISGSNSAKALSFEWNPCENKFAASTSDNVLLTAEYYLQKGSSYSMLGNLSAKSLVTCIAWSRKGQQLTVGDAEGRLTQLKPELSAPVRVIEAPQNVAELGPMQPLRCVGVCWVSTTEWLVAHAPQNTANGGISVCLLVAKKNQPISWTFYGYYASGTNVPLQPSIRFYFVENWILVGSSQSCFIRVISKQGEVWRPTTMAIQLPPSCDQSETYPLGCSFDFSSVAGSQQGLPPLFYIVTSDGFVSPYCMLSANPQHPLTTKTIEPFSIEQANFGNPPPGYQPQASQAPPPVLPVSNASPAPQQLPVMPTTVASTTASSLFGTAAASKQTSQPPQAKQSPAQPAPQVVQPTPKVVEAPKEESTAEKQAKELIQLEQAFEQSVAEYCKQRNAQAKKVDALRELRGEAEQWASTQTEDNYDDFSEMIRDVQVSLDDAVLGLENFQDHLIHNTELMRKMKTLASDILLEGTSKPKEGDFNQRKRMELLQKKYEKAVENFARMKLLLEKTTAKQASANALRIQNQEIDPTEQKRINETTQTISKMIVKLSAKIINLQKKVRSINAIRKSSPHHLNQSSHQELLGMSSGNVGDTTQLADQCTLMLKEVLIYEDTEGRRRSNRRSGMGDVEPEKVSQMQRNLYNLMKAHSQKPVPLTPVTPNKLLPECKYPGANKPAPTVSTPQLNTRSGNKPRLVSIGVQSPDFTRTTGTPSRAVSSSTPRTPVQTPSFPKPNFSSTPLSSNPAGVSAGPAAQKTVLGTAGSLFSPQTPVRSEKSTVAAQIVTTTQSNPASVSKAISSTSNISFTPLATPKVTSTPLPPVSTAPQSTAPQSTAPTFSFNLAAAAKEATTSGAASSTTAVPTPVSNAVAKNVLETPQPSVPGTTALGPAQPSEVAKQGTALGGSTAAAATNFTFKPPGGVAPPSIGGAVSGAAAAPAVKTSGEEGMEDEVTGGTGNTATSQPSSGGISFSFAGTGLGSSSSANANKNPFGSGMPPASSAQSPAANTNRMFKSQTGTPQTAQKPSIFGQGGSGGFASIQPNPAPSQTPFGGTAQSGASVQTGTGFGSAPAFGQGKSAFGGGPSFGSSSPFGGSGFGAGGPTPFSSPANQQQQPSTPGNTSGGFSAFANKSSGFGQLAANSSSPQQSLFGSGGGASSPMGTSSIFGGGAGPTPVFSNASKSAAFTAFRK